MDQEKSKRAGASRQVFISYKREDSIVALSLRQALRAEGVTVWWDEELRTGDRWDERIDGVLSTADAVVVLWSKASANSEWVKYEASIGRIQENLAHARIDSSEIPEPFRSIHVEDLSGWNGREDAPSFQRLLQAIRAISRRRLRAKRLRNIRLWAGMLLVILLSLGSGWMLHRSFGRPEIATVASNTVQLTPGPRQVPSSTSQDAPESIKKAEPLKPIAVQAPGQPKSGLRRTKDEDTRQGGSLVRDPAMTKSFVVDPVKPTESADFDGLLDISIFCQAQFGPNFVGSLEPPPRCSDGLNSHTIKISDACFWKFGSRDYRIEPTPLGVFCDSSKRTDPPCKVNQRVCDVNFCCPK